MSNPDSFIREVTEEVRRERVSGFLRRYGWIGVVLVLGVVGGAAWNEWSKAQRDAAAQGFGDAVLAAYEAPDATARLRALQAIETTGTRVAVQRLLVAAEAQAAGNRDQALAALSAVADDTALPARYRQLATLKRITLAGADMPLAEREQTLNALASPGQPLRPLAMEQLAVLRIEAGDIDAAVAILRELVDGAEVGPGLRRRASQVIVALGVDPQAG